MNRVLIAFRVMLGGDRVATHHAGPCSTDLAPVAESFNKVEGSCDTESQTFNTGPKMSTDRRNLDHQLRRLAATQSGYFSAAQALELGYSYPQQSYHTKQGNWQRVARGIYRFPEWPVGDHDDLVRWTLWSRGLGVVSHDTAISVHDLGDVNPKLVHLTVPPSFRAKSAGVVLHRGHLPEGAVWEREGYRITTPFRTAVDGAASDLSLEQLTEVVKSVCELAPSTASQQLRQEAERIDHRAALRMERALRGAGVL